jgi:endonuclease/exonuclease/phosphatase family metal-dependent hydrolase
MEFSVMTYNIKLGGESDLKTVADIIGEADVVAVQEIGVDWFEGDPGNQPQLLSRASGLAHVRFAAVHTVVPDSDPPLSRVAPTADDRPARGVALFSRFPLGPWTRHRLPKRQDQQRCILSGTVVTPKGPISVLVTHLSTHEIDRAAQIPALVRHAQTQASPLIALGDFHAEAHDPVMAALSPFLRNAAGDDPHPTYPAQMPEHAFDHIYITKELEVLTPAMPLPLMGSDHLPVIAKLKY